jgi:hypothetical protein
MEDSDYSGLIDRYRSMPPEELLRLYELKTDLRQEARRAVEIVAHGRHIELEGVRRLRAMDQATDIEWNAKQAEADQRERLRTTKRLKWYLVVLTPLVVLGFLLDPREPAESHWRPTTYLLVMVVAWWVAILVRWIVSRRRVNVGGGDA